MILPQYFAHLDGPQPMDGLAKASPDVRFLIALPDRAIEGNGQSDLHEYIANRGPAAQGRVHNLRVSATHGDVEFHYGLVQEQGATMGMLLAAAHITPDGRFDRYLCMFQSRVPLLGD